MGDRERLIKLIQEAEDDYIVYEMGAQALAIGIFKSREEYIADHLIANGVILPPCKVGDKLYILYSVTKEIEECDIIGFIIQTKHDVIQFKDGTIYTIWDKDYNAHFGKTLFLTREEAEKALERSKG